MRVSRQTRLPAFTLIELLTVVAIIGLLIGILVPSLTAARNQARNAATNGFIAGIGKSAEMFFNDNNRYPLSRGLDRPSPFHSTNRPVWGAQWIAMQLSGPDLRGYVKPALNNDSNADSVIDEQDWIEWYSLQPKKNGQEFEYPRLGPYIVPDGKAVASLRKLQNQGTVDLISDTDIADDDPENANGWATLDLPMYLDAFGRPILYYAANANAREPFTFGNSSGNFQVGRYDQFDNAGLTGNEDPYGKYADRFGPIPDGLRFSGQAPPSKNEPLHPLALLGWDAQSPNEYPQPTSFADFFADRNIFETTKRNNKGRVWPYNPDTFILISAGKDGRYGSDDDVANFQRSGG